MTGSSARRSRLAGTLTTPGATGCTAGVDASCSTLPPAARCHPHRVRCDKGGQRKPMSDLQAIADRVEIEALRGEFTDAAMMRDYDRFASLFTPDGAVRIPDICRARRPGGRFAPGSSGCRLSTTTSCKPRSPRWASGCCGPTAATSLPATAASAVPAVDRIGLRQPQRPARTVTPRRPHPPWSVHPRRPAAARPGSLHLTQLGHRGSGQAQPHRLRPLTTSFKVSII
jgi:hypothetical protein